MECSPTPCNPWAGSEGTICENITGVKRAAHKACAAYFGQANLKDRTSSYFCQQPIVIDKRIDINDPADPST